ncbi:MAG: beta-glucosidase [Verrucomicrobia bacterium]|nr:beta-glucosidase [Verrucomicrobiota bacterium]
MNTENGEVFQSFFIGGFECSTHRLRSGKRLDLVCATRHDEFAESDYRLLREHGICTVREGLRWHLIEAQPRRFDFSSAAALIDAACKTHTQVIWDLWHYGWPDDIEIFSTEFVDRFARYARSAAELLSENFPAPIVCPVNEISFFSWAGGEAGIFNPFAKNRGAEMKRQLVRASVAAINAMREVNREIRFCHIDPIINVIPERPENAAEAKAYHLSQFEACDMIMGRTAPELGGREDFVDLVGVNYYIHNQWTHPGHAGSMLVPSDPRYRHVRDLLQENYARYHKPIFVAETGIEDETRPAWLRYMCNEVYGAMADGVPAQGLCLYPILNHPGWEDDRHCYNGLFDYADEQGRREIYEPLARELARQEKIVAGIRAGEQFVDRRETDVSALDWAAHVMEERTDESRTEKEAAAAA